MIAKAYNRWTIHSKWSIKLSWWVDYISPHCMHNNSQQPENYNFQQPQRHFNGCPASSSFWLSDSMQHCWIPMTQTAELRVMITQRHPLLWPRLKACFRKEMKTTINATPARSPMIIATVFPASSPLPLLE